MGKPWFHMIPEIEGREKMRSKYAALVIALAKARDDIARGRDTSFSYTSMGQRFGTKGKPIHKDTVKRVARDLLGIEFEGEAKTGRGVVDLYGWYEDFQKNGYEFRKSAGDCPEAARRLPGSQEKNSRSDLQKTTLNSNDNKGDDMNNCPVDQKKIAGDCPEAARFCAKTPSIPIYKETKTENTKPTHVARARDDELMSPDVFVKAFLLGYPEPLRTPDADVCLERVCHPTFLGRLYPDLFFDAIERYKQSIQVGEYVMWAESFLLIHDDGVWRPGDKRLKNGWYNSWLDFVRPTAEAAFYALVENGVPQLSGCEFTCDAVDCLHVWHRNHKRNGTEEKRLKHAVQSDEAVMLAAKAAVGFEFKVKFGEPKQETQSGTKGAQGAS